MSNIRYCVDIENAHLDDRIAKRTFLDRFTTAHARAMEWSKTYAGEWTTICFSDDHEDEDCHYYRMTFIINGREYGSGDEEFNMLLAKELTTSQARRLLMNQNGISMQRIADIENQSVTNEYDTNDISKATIQASIEQARKKLTSN